MAGSPYSSPTAKRHCARRPAFVCLDLETDGLFDDDPESEHYGREVNITCASTLHSASQRHILWCSMAPGVTTSALPVAPSKWSCEWAHKEAALDEEHAKGGEDSPLCLLHMDVHECERLLHYMERCVSEGDVVLTFNGGSYDFRVLATVFTRYGRRDLARRTCELCKHHSDLLFTFLTFKGFFVKLSSIAKAMLPRQEENSKSMTGAEAVIKWESCKGTQQRDVLRYVLGDTYLLLQIAHEVEDRKRVLWVSKSNRVAELDLSRIAATVPHLLAHYTIDRCLAVKLPDTAWMQKKGMQPINRAQVLAWLDM